MFVGWVIAILVILVQFYLSRKENVYWGAILPALYIFYIVGWFIKKLGEVDTVSLVFAAVGGLAFLLSIWANGRESMNKKRKRELEKIELHDL